MKIVRSLKMHWFLSTIFLIFTFSNLSEAKHQNKLSSAVVVGSVYCNTCFQADFSKTSHFISGALVAVECEGTSTKPSFQEVVKTSRRGKFRVNLPFSVAKHVKKIKKCSVKLIRSSEPYCAVASIATSSSLHLKSRKQGTQIFSAGFFTFKPLKQPTLCNQKPSAHNSKEFNSRKISITLPIQVPTILTPSPVDQFLFPPLPGLPQLPPLPRLPPLPPLPGLPNFPPAPKKSVETKPSTPLKTSKLVSNGKVTKQQLPEVPLFQSPPPALGISLPPNPFLLPPNPFQAPPMMLPPNRFQPLPPLVNVPPIPDLTTSPTPPAFPVVLPPFPFQPSPGFPGFPSTSSSKKTSP